MPLSSSPELRGDLNQAVFPTFGRMRAGATSRQVAAELGILRVQATREHPTRERREVASLAPYRGGVGTDTPVSTAFLLMMGAVGFVLLIACANVANLMLVRALARAREVSVRQSLGASRWHIVRQLLAESLALALVAGAVALVLARVGVGVAVREIARSGGAPYWLDFTMDAATFAFFAIVCGGTAVLSGLVPAWLSSARSLREAMTDAGHAVAGGRRQRRWTSAFVVGQLALSLVLLSGAGAMIRSVIAQMRVDPGIDTSQLVTMRLELAGPTYREVESRAKFYRAIDERLAALPVPVALARQVPLDDLPDARLVTDVNPEASFDARPEVGRMPVTTNYFAVVGTRGRGRTFPANEGEPVTVINQRLAALAFPDVDPIGHRLRLTGRRDPPNAASQWFTIIGVVPNIRQAAREGGEFDPVAYFPFTAVPETTAFAIARTSLPAGYVVAALGEQVRAIDPDLTVFDVRTLADRLAQNQWGQRFAGSLFAVFAGLALLLAIV